MKNPQSNKSYINLIKNMARLGAGSALLLVHIAILGGTAVMSRRAQKQKQKLKENAIKALPYEK